MEGLKHLLERNVFTYAVVLRVVLLVYAAWHDAALPIRYTDVDYTVFSGAAALVAAGRSPYAQPGYRYPPAVAWLLVPGVWLGIPGLWGRALFAIGDVLCGAVAVAAAEAAGAPRAVARASAGLLLLSPLSAVLSTRGSMDSLSCLLCLAVALVAEAPAGLRHRAPLLGAAVGAAVHLRLYPVIYVLPLSLHLLFPPRRPAAAGTANFGAALSFLLAAAAAFAAPTGLALWAHGWDAVRQAYLYHGARVDAAHSFSPLWVHIHASLAAGGDGGWAVAAPWSLLAALAVGAAAWRDPALCLFLQTLAFVSLNRVVTAQYFSWWAALLPLLAPRCTLGRAPAAALGGAWLAAYAHWLLWAYRLEHLALPVHRQLGAAAWLFFAANAAVGVAAARYRRAAAGAEPAARRKGA